MERVREERKEGWRRMGEKDSQLPEFPQAGKGTAGVLDCSRNVIVLEFPIDRQREKEKESVK